MPRAVVMTHQHQEWARSWTAAFAAGLERHGWDVRRTFEYEPCDLLVMWGVRRREAIEAQRKRGDICVLERGYLLDRMKDWASVSFGGELNGRAEFRGPLADATRWKEHFAHLMQPWKSGEYALILGQVPGDMSVRGVDLEGFYSKAREAFKGMPVRFRHHPVHAERNRITSTSLADDLAGAAVAVTWNSNSGVDAVLAGVPTVAMDEGSMAWDVTGHALEMPQTPDRKKWAHKLAWCQYNKAELASGECWARVGDDREAA